MAMSKKPANFKKHPAPHRKAFAPAKTKSAQTRKAGKASAHFAAKPQSRAQTADSNMSPVPPMSGKPAPNAADFALAQLQKGNKG